MQHYPSASIIVSVYNASTQLDACLRSLLALEYPDYEIICVDDASTDDSAAKLAMWQAPGRLRVLRLARNAGVPAARNAGIAVARGEVCVFTDADCRVSSDWLVKLLAPIQHREVACVGGPDQAPEEDGLIAQCVDYAITSRLGSGGLRRHSAVARFSPTGSNMAVRSKVLERLGGFDERLWRRGEEKELAHRIRQAGHVLCYVPDAMVEHHRRGTLGGFWRQTFASGGARVDILRLAPGAIEPAHLFPAVLTAVLIAALLVGVVDPRQIWPWLVLGGYAMLVLANGILGLLRLRRPAVLPLVALTTAMVHLGYGVGFWMRMFGEWLLRVPLRAKNA